jgi:hypothetical protein
MVPDIRGGIDPAHSISIGVVLNFSAHSADFLCELSGQRLSNFLEKQKLLSAEFAKKGRRVR